MGCDIHPRVQVRPPYLKSWRSVAVPDDGRNYGFFELLNGVRQRHGFGGLFATTEVPSELGGKESYDKHEAGDFGDHSFSSWTLREMKESREEARAFCQNDRERLQHVYGRYESWIALGEVMKAHHGAESDDDVRFVVGYDN